MSNETNTPMSMPSHKFSDFQREQAAKEDARLHAEFMKAALTGVYANPHYNDADHADCAAIALDAADACMAALKAREEGR